MTKLYSLFKWKILILIRCEANNRRNETKYFLLFQPPFRFSIIKHVDNGIDLLVMKLWMPYIEQQHHSLFVGMIPYYTKKKRKPLFKYKNRRLKKRETFVFIAVIKENRFPRNPFHFDPCNLHPAVTGAGNNQREMASDS